MSTEERAPEDCGDGGGGGANDLRSKILAIMRDTTLTEEEKAKKRQALMMGMWAAKPEVEEAKKEVQEDKKTAGTKGKNGAGGSSHAGPEGELHENLKCAICLNLCERPVTAPCQHNFCLSCFNKWVYQGKRTCPTCRAGFPSKFAQNPRINTALTFAIRLAKNPVKVNNSAPKDYRRIDNEQRPDQAFVTERAVRAGRANAASGRIMVNIPNDHFGPILPEHDPSRSTGILVGEWWKDRLDCRQWGAHFPHVAGIAGQSNVGAQSVVLSGGYEDDRDEGEWFLYTGSGGRDLSGNKRTNKEQSFDQEFTAMNKALLLSCQKGLPVRVVRSHKEKRSAYAPSEENPVRYDGIYRILRCWRKPGNQNFLMCRYLFVRCDNSPAPWSSAETGDEVRLYVPEEAQKEIDEAQGKVFEMTDKPYWDWLPDQGCWGFAKPAPASQKVPGNPRGSANPAKKLKAKANEHEKALKEFKCLVCKDVLRDPLSTPCGHNFCKSCLDRKFAGISDVQAASGSRSLRVRKNQKPCPACKADICEFLATAQVNREMQAIIQKLQDAVTKARAEAEKLASGQQGVGDEGGDEEGEEDVEGEEPQEDEESAEAGEEAPAAPAPAPGPSSELQAAVQAAAAAAAAAALAAATGGSAEARAAAAAEAGPDSTACEAQAASAAGGKYAKELAQLKTEFPQYDDCLILSFLEDQAGDMLDVRVFLKKLAKQTQGSAKSSPAAGAKKTAGGRGRGRGRGRGAAAGGRGRKRKAQSDDDDDDYDHQDDQIEEESDQESGEAAAAAANGWDAAAAAQAAAGAEGAAEEGDEPAAKKRRM